MSVWREEKCSGQPLCKPLRGVTRGRPRVPEDSGPVGQPSFLVGTEDGGGQEEVGSWIHSPGPYQTARITFIRSLQ